MSAVSSTSELTTKEIVEQAISDYHESILPYLNGQVPVIANKFDKTNLYSTDEKIVGTWIDGKPLYQKTFTGLSATINTGSWTNGICTIPNGDNLVDFKAYNLENSHLLDISSSLDIIAIHTATSSVNALSFDSGQNRQINIFIAWYTKTTD